MSEWRKTTIGDVANFYNGKAHEDCVSGRGSYILVNSRFVSTNGGVYKKSIEQRFPLITGDIAMVMSDVPKGKALARCFLVLEDNKYTLNQRICCFRTKTESPDYLCYILDRNKFYLSFDTGVTQTNLRKEEVLECPVILPPKEEQIKIVCFLKTWDTAIEKTEALIAAKQKQFDWLLRTLISHPSETKRWRKVTLQDVGDISSAGVDKKIVKGEIEVVLLNYLDVYRRDMIFADELHHKVTAPTSKVKKCSIQKGDIFFTPSSEVRGDIGLSAVAMEDVPDGVYSYHIVRLRPKIEIDVLYSAYAFKSYNFYKQAAMYADGSGQRYVVSQNSFRKIELLLPPILEQRSIANTLHTAQQEINQLKKLADLYRTQKRGLMQKLLSGEWRIQDQNEEAA